MGFYIRVNQRFPFSFYHLVQFTLQWVTVPPWGLGVSFSMSLVYYVGSVIEVHREFPFDFDQLVQFPFPWVPA